MHLEALKFTALIRNAFVAYFTGKKVLDVGGGDVNGNNRLLFKDCDYTANDVVNGPNVTLVSRTKDLTFPDATFDTIISTECFEHDPEWEDSLRKIYALLKPGGLLVYTCATTGRPEHGTRRTEPVSFGTMAGIVDMQDYYRNLSFEDLRRVLPDDLFLFSQYFVKPDIHDVYFYGVKKLNKHNSLAGPSTTDMTGGLPYTA